MWKWIETTVSLGGLADYRVPASHVRIPLFSHWVFLFYVCQKTSMNPYQDGGVGGCGNKFIMAGSRISVEEECLTPPTHSYLMCIVLLPWEPIPFARGTLGLRWTSPSNSTYENITCE